MVPGCLTPRRVILSPRNLRVKDLNRLARCRRAAFAQRSSAIDGLELSTQRFQLKTYNLELTPGTSDPHPCLPARFV